MTRFELSLTYLLGFVIIDQGFSLLLAFNRLIFLIFDQILINISKEVAGMLRVFDRLGYSKESLMQNAYLLFDCFEGPKNLEVRVLHKYESTQFCIGFQIFL